MGPIHQNLAVEGTEKNRSITVILEYQQERKEKAFYSILKVWNELLLLAEYQLSHAVNSKNYGISIVWKIPHRKKTHLKNSLPLPHPPLPV